MSAAPTPPTEIESLIVSAARRQRARAVAPRQRAFLNHLYRRIPDVLAIDRRAFNAVVASQISAGLLPHKDKPGRGHRAPTPADAASLVIGYLAAGMLKRETRMSDAVALQALRFELIGLELIDTDQAGAVTNRMVPAGQLGPDLQQIAVTRLGLGQCAGGLLFRRTLTQAIADGWTGRSPGPGEPELLGVSIGIAARVPYAAMTIRDAGGSYRIWWAEAEGYAALQGEMSEPGAAARFISDRALAVCRESSVSAWALHAVGRLLGAPTADDIAAWSLAAVPPCDPVPAE